MSKDGKSTRILYWSKSTVTLKKFYFILFYVKMYLKVKSRLVKCRLSKRYCYIFKGKTVLRYDAAIKLKNKFML